MFSYPPYLQPLPYYSLSPQKEIIERARQAKDAGKRVVIASGVFDLLHEAHVSYLTKSKEQGEYLIVLVESDVRTRELKGEGRPVWNQDKRRETIQNLHVADDVLILPPEFKNPLRFEEIVILLAPDVYAESSNSVALDHKIKLMEKYGGRVEIVLQEIPGVSTTQVLAAQTA
jgi:cytidyltransferase-like protein